MRIMRWKIPRFHVKTLFIGNRETPLLKLNNRNNEENKKRQKIGAVHVRQPTTAVEGEGRYCEEKNSLQCTARLVFFVFFSSLLSV